MNFKMSNFLDFSELISNESEFIPLLTEEDEEQMNTEQVPDSLPVLPLRNTVLFPGVTVCVLLTVLVLLLPATINYSEKISIYKGLVLNNFFGFFYCSY